MSNNKQFLSTKDMVICVLFTSLIAILSQFSIPMPSGVPCTLQTLAIGLAGVILGAKRGLVSTFVYILLGAIGAPVFAQFLGGFSVILGPTGGFILSFPIMAYIIGFCAERTDNKYYLLIVIIFANIFNLLCGTFMFSIVANTSIAKSFVLCFWPFVPTAIIKAIITVWFGLKIKQVLGNAL